MHVMKRHSLCSGTLNPLAHCDMKVPSHCKDPLSNVMQPGTDFASHMLGVSCTPSRKRCWVKFIRPLLHVSGCYTMLTRSAGQLAGQYSSLYHPAHALCHNTLVTRPDDGPLRKHSMRGFTCPHLYDICAYFVDSQGCAHTWHALGATQPDQAHSNNPSGLVWHVPGTHRKHMHNSNHTV
jgi:hypothetical protein